MIWTSSCLLLLCIVVFPNLAGAILVKEHLRGHIQHHGIAKDDDQSSSDDSTEAVLAFSASANRGSQILTVDLSGGLGNQLFQLAALFSIATDSNHQFSVVLPDVGHVFCNRTTYWHSALQKLRPLLAQTPHFQNQCDGLHIEADSGQCRVQQVHGASLSQVDRNCSHASTYDPNWASNLAKLSSCPSLSLHGYFQNPAFFARHLPLLRKLFWDDASAEKAAVRLASLVPSKNSSIVSLHYRLGDFEPNGWVLDQDYYEESLRKVRQYMPRPLTCLIFSDEPQRAWSRSAQLEDCDERVLVPPEDDDVTSFYMMSLTNVSVLADSSFSYWAALLGSKRLVVAPGIDGPKSDCWSYLLKHSNLPLETEWVVVPVKQVSQQALFIEELLNLGPADD